MNHVFASFAMNSMSLTSLMWLETWYIFHIHAFYLYE
jgi:hypothetical protein